MPSTVSLKNLQNRTPDTSPVGQYQSAVESIVHEFRALLTAGELKPGDRLPNEKVLMQAFGSSRGTVREAMRILSAYGVTDVRRGDGTYISSTAEPQILDAMMFRLSMAGADRKALRELRELIEVGMISLVIRNATDSDIAALEAAHADFIALNAAPDSTPESVTRDDMAFHELLAGCTRNRLIEAVYRFTLGLLRSSIRATKTGRKNYAVEHHQRMLNALKARDDAQMKRAVLDSIEEWMDLSVNQDAG